MKYLEGLSDISSKSSHSISKLSDELRALESHVEHLGESTAIACKHLTSGMNDVQECSMDISDWAQKLSYYVDELINRVDPTNKSLCPKIKFVKFSLEE